MNISLTYLYRDAGNNKIWGEVIFSNKMNFDVSTLEEKIKNELIDGEFFVAEDLCLPSLRFERYDEELDHGWHEYFCVKETADCLNDCLGRDVGDFVRMLKVASLRTT
jgi:hypothetical protein